MGDAVDTPRRTIGFHRRRRPGGAGDGPAARPLRHRLRRRREERRPRPIIRSRAAAGCAPWSCSASGASRQRFASAACRTIPTCSSSSTASPGARSAGRGPSRMLGHTPAWKSLVAQDAVEEEILRVVAQSPHVTVLFGTECESASRKPTTASPSRPARRRPGETREWTRDLPDRRRWRRQPDAPRRRHRDGRARRRLP